MSEYTDRVQAELQALAAHAEGRGLTETDMAQLCAVFTGILIRNCAQTEADRRTVLATVYEIMRDHAGLDDRATS